LGVYRTAFEVSYFADDTILGFCFLAAGILVSIVAIRLWKVRAGLAAAFATFVGFVFTLVSIILICFNLWESHRFIAALRTGHCGIAEGTVEVLHMEPAEGHDPGDRIRINGREFQFSNYRSTVAYNQTISHGGVLVQGARARLHYIGNDILKVEVAQKGGMWGPLAITSPKRPRLPRRFQYAHP
jgi:hypothetical protein